MEPRAMIFPPMAACSGFRTDVIDLFLSLLKMAGAVFAPSRWQIVEASTSSPFTKICTLESLSIGIPPTRNPWCRSRGSRFSLVVEIENDFGQWHFVMEDGMFFERIFWSRRCRGGCAQFDQVADRFVGADDFEFDDGLPNGLHRVGVGEVGGIVDLQLAPSLRSTLYVTVGRWTISIFPSRSRRSF